MRKYLMTFIAATALSLCGFTAAGQGEFSEYLAKAKKGDPEAMLQVGGYYDWGSDSEDIPIDKQKAVYWYTKAAEAGNVDAQVIMGEFSMLGTYGVAQDGDKAFKYFQSAAKQGDADGAYGMYICYNEGIGVKRDTAEAVKWIRVAAGRGQGMAQFHYGRLLVLDERYIEAKDLFQKALKSGRLEGKDLSDCREMLELINELYK